MGWVSGHTLPDPSTQAWVAGPSSRATTVGGGLGLAGTAAGASARSAGGGAATGVQGSLDGGPPDSAAGSRLALRSAHTAPLRSPSVSPSRNEGLNIASTLVAPADHRRHP